MLITATSPAPIPATVTFTLDSTLDTVKFPAVKFSRYESSPEYVTAIDLFPAVKFSISNVTTPSMILVVLYNLPSIEIVTVPVAFSGTVTTITALSPTEIPVVLTLIGASYLGM